MDQTQISPTGGTPVAAELSDDHLAVLQQAVDAAGVELERHALVLVLCAVLFTLGVVVRCIHGHGKGLPPLRLFAIALPTFFLTSPVQAWVLTTNWGDSRLTPFDWLAQILREGGSFQIIMFAFGIIMMIGYMVEPIFTRVSALVHKGLHRNTAVP